MIFLGTMGGDDENVGLMRRKLCYQCKITHKCGRLLDEKAFAQKYENRNLLKYDSEGVHYLAPWSRSSVLCRLNYRGTHILYNMLWSYGWHDGRLFSGRVLSCAGTRGGISTGPTSSFCPRGS